MLKTNRERLVMQSVTGKVHNPTVRGNVYRVTTDGKAVAYPTVGAICYNVTLGDSVFGWVGDHIEPDVSTQNADNAENGAYNFLSCIGNKARVLSGDAKGKEGFVTGTHGGIEHVIVWFDSATKELLAPDDKILVKSFGQGLAIEGYDDVRVMNVDPDLFEKFNIREKDGRLSVGVKAIIPARFMGSGIGSTAFSGDYDIMTASKGELEKYGIDKLRFGDLVVLEDCDTVYGRGYSLGSGTVGVVIHSDCLISGHGPGVTTVMSCKTDRLSAFKDEDANIGKMLGVVK